MLNDPTDQALRVHLASVLAAAGRPAEALNHCLVALAAMPDDARTLEIAQQAAEATGDQALADRYERLLQAVAPERRTAAAEASGPSIPSTGLHADATVPLTIVDGELIDTGDIGEIQRPQLTLKDVGGMTAVKKRLDQAFLAPMRNPQLREMYGKSLRGGLLLYGPPGCGKTFIARATAGELGARFFPVGLSDVLDMWLGASERNLHEVFQTARRNAPCVLFLDEVDALGQKRTQTRNIGGMRNVIAQLLNEMDSVAADNEGVFVLAATNHPWDVDSALRRPGRFDRLMLVLPPDADARFAILNYHLKDRPVGKIDLPELVKLTRGYSGADIAHVCETAAEYALQKAIDTGQPEPISAADLTAALREVTRSTDAWFQTAKHFAMFANDSGLYDDLIQYMKSNKLV